jgi:hypothetical protein
LRITSPHLTVPTAIPSANCEEKVSWTDRGYHIFHLVMRGSGSAEVEFVALMRHLRPVRRFRGEPDVRDRHHEIPRSSGPASVATQAMAAACNP